MHANNEALLINAVVPACPTCETQTRCPPRSPKPVLRLKCLGRTVGTCGSRTQVPAEQRNDGPRSRRLTSEAGAVTPCPGGPRPFRGEEGCSAGSSAHPVFFSCFQPLEQSHIIALCPEAMALLDANAALCFIFSQAA